MKNIINKLFKTSLLAATMLFFACEEELTVFEGPYHVRFTNTVGQINENATTTTTIPVHFAGTTQSSAIDITLSVSGGQPGVDFNFVTGGTSVTIPAGEFSTNLVIDPIDNLDNDGNKVITFTIESVSGGFGAGFGLVGKTFRYTIIDDDCAAPNLEGTYLVVNRDASPAACGNPANDGVLTYEATVELISENGNERVYSVSDITGGLYALCYGDGPNPGQFVTNRLVIVVDSQPDVVYGGDEFNGTGNIACNGNFVISWSNGFGDRGTSTYTRK